MSRLEFMFIKILCLFDYVTLKICLVAYLNPYRTLKRSNDVVYFNRFRVKDMFAVVK